MAIPTMISFTLRDSDGDPNTVPIFVQSGLTLAQYTSFSDAAVALLDAVTGAKVESANLTIGIALPGGLKASAVANSENQLGALFSLNTPARYKHGLRVPAWLPALFAGKEVDLEGAGVAAFVNMLTAGLDIGGTQVTPRDGYDNDLVSVATATKSHRRK